MIFVSVEEMGKIFTSPDIVKCFARIFKGPGVDQGGSEMKNEVWLDVAQKLAIVCGSSRFLHVL